MIIGILNVISVDEMSVITYAFRSYELAIEQAIELQKGVDLSDCERFPEIKMANGLRQTVWKYPMQFELVTAQEIALGESILPVGP